MTDNVNPSGGTVEDAARILLERDNQSAPAETEDETVTEPDEGNPDPVDETEEPEADETDDESKDEPDDDAEDTEDVPEEPQKFTVKIGGKDVEVTLEEALAGYMKDQDYRAKTTEVAETRKAVEAEKAKVADLSKVREEYLTESKTLQGLIETFKVPNEKLDELLKSGKTDLYLQAKAQNEKIQQQITALRSKDEQVQNQITEEQKQELAQRESTEREALLKVIPELGKDENQKALGSYLIDLGFNQEEITSTLDHRLFVMAEKARRYDAIQSKAKDKPVAKVPKVQKGTAARKSGAEIQEKKLQELQSKAKRSGSIHDVAALLMEKSK